MLRITGDESGALTFQVEGRLSGRSLQALEECWRTALAEPRRPAVRVDLRAATFIDAAGKEFLATIYRQGAELIAAGCATRDVVAEIIRSSS